MAHETSEVERSQPTGREYTVLHRHGACAQCRRKKMRCDGSRPSCGPCLRSKNGQSCTYDETPQSKTQMLLNKIKDLEEQIQSLELLNTISPGSSLHSSSMTAGAAPRGPIERPVYPPEDWIDGSVPNDLQRTLIFIFLRHRHQFFFEPLLPQFFATLDLPSIHPAAFHPCFINVMCLLGCFYSRSTHGAYEDIFLQRTRRELEQSLSMADRLFHFITASALLARWYTYNGRLVEGHTQTTSVAQFATSCLLGEISSPWLSDLPDTLLGPASSATEVGERISMFWNIFVLDRTVSLSSGLVNTLREDNISTMWPQPLEYFQDGRAMLQQYGSISTMFRPHDSSLNVAQDALFLLPIKSIALLDHAAHLASRARAAEATPDSQGDDSALYSSALSKNMAFRQKYQDELAGVEAGIRRFIDTLPPLSDMRDLVEEQAAFAQASVMYGDGLTNLGEAYYGHEKIRTSGNEPILPVIPSASASKSVNPVFASVHISAQGAAMEFRSITAPHDPAAQERVVRAARKIARIAHEADGLDICVACGLTLTAACDVLIREASHLQASQVGPDNVILGQTRIEAGWILSNLTLLAASHPLFEQGCVRLRCALDALV